MPKRRRNFSAEFKAKVVLELISGEKGLMAALQSAIQNRVPEIHHSDQGIHYAAQDYVSLLHQHRIRISMAAVGMPEENGYAERLMRTIKEEEVALAEYRDFAEAKQQIGIFIDDVYATKRTHSALGYLTPAEFEAAWRSQTTPSPKRGGGMSPEKGCGRL